MVSISNGFKETNNLQNKLKNGGEIIYQSPNANSILQTLLQTSRYSANTIDKANSTINKQYFTSINLETDDFLISISNAPKKEKILKNKVEKGAKIIYQSPNSESIFYTPELLQASQSLANKIDKANSTIKEQSKQHKGQEELKNIFDEF